jgi:hypothetical protein
MQTQFFTVSAAVSGGERFAIVRPEDMTADSRVRFNSVQDWCRQVEIWIRDHAVLTESDARVQLAEMGLTEEAVDGQIRLARKARWSWENTTVERISPPKDTLG